MTGRTAVDDFRQVTGLDHATSDDTVRLARTAAEAVRGLNHLTGHDASLAQPSAAHDITGALALTASRLGQLLTQIERWLDHALAWTPPSSSSPSSTAHPATAPRKERHDR